jgi:hypothetical protein
MDLGILCHFGTFYKDVTPSGLGFGLRSTEMLKKHPSKNPAGALFFRLTVSTKMPPRWGLFF